ncbi:MAG TPA: DJ-1/PfpI family protein [Kofleriaceae bacterium]|jgi:cyclohexyl-isocyanide hydratase|nr:DJ-1/PfpI family protein [Kofleriaceae bacterium]
MNIGMVLFPRVTQLDLTGPYEVLARIPGATVHVVAKTRDPVPVEVGGLQLVPTTTFSEAPPVDLLFVPGGGGQVEATEDSETLDWIHATGEKARWITSACTGSLLLGAAGLLKGYRAATHWAFMELLPLVGAIPTNKRVVVDRNRMTSGGVTAGIDIALTIASETAGRETAELIQLYIEYDPEPPFRSGHPNVASPELVAQVRERVAKRYGERQDLLSRIAAGL